MRDKNSPIELAAAPDFPLGDAWARPSSREVEGQGVTIALEPRVMQVLVLLAERRGEAVTRDELIARCWGGVVVGDDAVQRCVGKLRKLAAAVGGFEIETLSRIGYRLKPLPAAAPSPATAQAGANPSIVVLDVKTAGASERDRAFAQALADDIAAALSLHRDLSVIARSAAAPDIHALRDKLGADYMVEARQRRVEGRRRVTLQLIETRAARVAWSHREPDAPEESEATFEEFVIGLAGRLVDEVMRCESARAMRKQSGHSAWEAVVRSSTAYQHFDAESLAFAVAEARRGVALEPDYAGAHAALASALAASYETDGARAPALAAEARRHAERALALAPDNATVLAWAAHALAMTTRPLEGLETARRAVALGPNNTIAHLYLARRYLLMNQPQEALAALEEHERLGPHFPWRFYTLFTRAMALFGAKRLEEAESALAHALAMNPRYALAWLAQCLLMLARGRRADARNAARRLKQLEGEDSLALQGARIDHACADPQERERLRKLLRAVWARA